MSRWGRSGIVNVRMVITEEKILSNIDKIHRIINPNSKKQIVELDEDSYFKDLIESVKTYLIEYPKKKNFPATVYKAAYDLVEYATNQFEENTKQIEELIRQRERNITLANVLRDTLMIVENRESGWKDKIKEISKDFPQDVIDSLGSIGRSKAKTTQNYEDCLKLINARINNLEVNLHIEIDMERIEDRSKALSYIGIEVAEALKLIPKPVEEIQAIEETIEEAKVEEEVEEYYEETRVKVKQSLWSKIKNSKLVRAVKYVFQIRVVLELPALPEGRGEF